MNSRLETRWPLFLAIIVLLAGIVRTAIAISLWALPHSYLLNADAGEYHHQALVLAGLAQGSIPAVFQLSPGATLWGAGWHWLFGPSVWAVIIPQIALGCGTVAFAASTARRLGGIIAGMSCGILLALCEPLALYEVSILPTGPAVFLFTLFAWFAVHRGRDTSPSTWLILGLVVGAATVFRANATLLLPVGIALAVAASRRVSNGRAAIAIGVLFLGFAIPVAPIVASNCARGGAFVPVTSAMGMNLFIGNHQGSTGRLNPVFGAHHATESFERFERIAEERAGRELDPAEISSFWTDRTIEEIVDDPSGFAALLGKKLVYGLNDFEAPDNIAPAFLDRIVPALGLPLPGFGFLLVLSLVGNVVAWRSKRPGARAIHGVTAVCLITMLAFFVSGRYRAPALPMLAIAAGVTVSWSTGKIRELMDRTSSGRLRSAVSLALASLSLVFGTTLTMLPILHSKSTEEMVRLTAAYEAERRYTEAVKCAEKILENTGATDDTETTSWAREKLEQLKSRTL